jgi:hypothetical protein
MFLPIYQGQEFSYSYEVGTGHYLLFTNEAFPKLQFLEKLLTPGENCICPNCYNTRTWQFSPKPLPKLTEFWKRLK